MAGAWLSWVKIKPASKGRNDRASGARLRPHENRGTFLSNKPDINELMRACLEEKDLRRIGGWVIWTIAGWFVVTADTWQ
jgi:hypothetical protein